ncbi:hypothetical protein TNCT_292121 [Trichonephila clavata]|uniref:HTH CENPB-type domain-containing protein n=1 Tax=Trichonephila clavata TaxID=2740835 RepID=A0A8X6LXD1_TRICU|nr:hypothetical protein TNCT_292121 [Trichonephila clavata]
MVAEVAKGTARLNIRGLFPAEMEDLLLIWIKEREIAGDTLSQNAMCQKARQIYQNLKVKTPGLSLRLDREPPYFKMPGIGAGVDPSTINGC